MSLVFMCDGCGKVFVPKTPGKPPVGWYRLAVEMADVDWENEPPEKYFCSAACLEDFARGD
jgi:hypothetical protein